jgi:hypothetical protein
VTITAPTTATVMIADLPLPCRRLILFPMAVILPQHEQHVAMSGTGTGRTRGKDRDFREFKKILRRSHT